MDEDKTKPGVEEPVETGIETPRPAAKPVNKPGNWKKIALIVVFALIIGALAWLYLSEKNNAEDLNNQLTAALADSAGEEPDSDATDEEPAAEITSDPCSEGATYTAEASNIKLSLDAGRVIVVNHDGGFEGGPITALTVATCSGDTNVFESPTIGEVKVQSQPSNGSSEFIAQNPDITTEGDSIKIDGKTAKVFIEDGLFETVYIFASVDGFNTTITGSRDGASGDFTATTQAVLNGISFK